MTQTIKEMYSFLAESFQIYSDNNRIWILFPIALILILFLGKKSDRKLFLATIAIEFLTIFNPFFMKFFLEIFSFENRYLRFFWMTLFFITIAYAMVLLIFHFKRVLVRILAGLLCVVFILFLGVPVFWGKEVPPYTKAENEYFTSSEILELSGIFHSEELESPTVLYGGLMLVYRQYDPSVISFLTRNVYQNMQGLSFEEFRDLDRYSKRLRELYLVYYYGDYSIRPDRFYRHLTYYDIDYVVSSSEHLDEYLSSLPVSLLGQTEHYRVWKVLPKE